MDDRDTPALDLATEVAWNDFEARLAAQLTLLAPDELVALTVERAHREATGPRFEFINDEGRLCLEIATTPDPALGFRIDEHRAGVLVALGLSPFGAATDDGDTEAGPSTCRPDPTWVLDAPLSSDEANRQACITVRVLREVLDVIHPAFVHCERLNDDRVADNSHLPTSPNSHPHLVQLVDDVLTAELGFRPKHDDDGDVPLVSEGCITYVRVHAHAPIVEIFAIVAQDIDDLAAAAFEVNVLNRDSVFVRYALAGTTVLARLCLPAQPFVPQHLRDLLRFFTDAVETAAPDLVHRVGGHQPRVQADGDPF